MVNKDNNSLVCRKRSVFKRVQISVSKAGGELLCAPTCTEEGGGVSLSQWGL